MKTNRHLPKNARLILAGFTLLLTAGRPLTVCADDWPQFRGPNRDGVSAETGLLQKWPDAGPPKVWTASGLGDAASGSVAVVKGVIYGAGQKAKKNHLWALDEATGQLKWSKPFGDVGKQRMNSTPTFANGKLYVVSGDGDLVCADAASGDVVWRKHYVTDFGGKDPGWGGFSESVLVDDGKVICAPGSMDAAIVALNPNTGEVIWKTPMPKANVTGFGSAIKAEFGGIPMYVILLNRSQGGLTAVEAKTGRLLWQGKPAGIVMGGPYLIPNPILNGDRVFIGTGDGWAALQLTMSGKDSMEAKLLKSYRMQELCNYYGGMVRVGDFIYLAHGHQPSAFPPACVDAKSLDIKWKAEGFPENAAVSASVVAADGMIYFQYEDDLIALVKADPTKFTLVSSFKLSEPAPGNRNPTRSNPAIANGKLYLRTKNQLHCFNIKK